MRYDPKLLLAVAEAMAGTAVEVRGEVQAMAAVSFGISSRLSPRLPPRPIRRPLSLTSPRAGWILFRKVPGHFLIPVGNLCFAVVADRGCGN